MGVGIVPVNTGAPTTGYSFPTRVSFAFFDDGGGGTLIVNGGGINGVGIVDLHTLFSSVGKLFRSFSLLQAFRPLLTPGSGNETEDRIIQELDIRIITVSTSVTPMAVAYNVPVPTANQFPGVGLNGPGAAGTWRVDISLRHSIPG